MLTKETGNTFGLCYFTLQGIGALVGWNAVLTSLDYFDSKFPGYQVNFLFPIAIFVANMLLSPNMMYFSQKFSLNIRIAGALGLLCLVMSLLPVEAYIFSDSAIGLDLILGLLFILGIANTSQQVSASGFASIFPYIYINKYVMGTGLAGMIISGLRIVILLALGDDADTESGQIIGILIYYGVAALFIVFNIAVHFRFIKTDFCKQTIATQDEKKKLLLAEQESGVSNTIASSVAKKVSNPWMQLFDVFSHMKRIVALMVLIYIQTFMMFPGVTLLKKLTILNVTWENVLLVAAYNVFDVVGKYFTNYRQFYTLNTTTILVFARFLFYIPFLLMAMNYDWPIINSNWFPFVNVSLFAMTNGFATSSLFILGPEQVPENKKEAAGFLTMFSLLAGIFAGSFLALIFTNLNG
jgi:equilibrative nucleoside transporter 1/2/3